MRALFFLFFGRRKEEAEEKRTRAKKARMGFMKMLAQNTQIDGRSRWDDAERTLRDDARFKAVPDSSDREDLFNEFVEALTKKEKVRGAWCCRWGFRHGEIGRAHV